MKEKSYQEKSYSKFNSIAGGILLISIAVLCLVSLFGGFGGVGTMIRGFLLGFFGLASYGYVISLLLVGGLIMMQKRPTQSGKVILFLSLIFVFGLIIFQATTSQNFLSLSYGDYLVKCFNVDFTAGGLLYGLIAYPIAKAIGITATIVVFSLFMVVFAIILAMPLVNRDYNFSFSRKDRPSSYNREVTSKPKKVRNSKDKELDVDNPKAPALTMLDEEQEELISQDSDIISYKRYDNDKLTDFDGGKRSRFDRFGKYTENEDSEYDENIDIESALNSEDADIRRKAALKVLYPDKNGGLLNYDGSILNDIRKVTEEDIEEPENNEDKYKNLNLTDIIKQSNTEEGRRRLVNQKLEDIKTQEPAPQEKEDIVESVDTTEEDVDNCSYIDQFGVRRRYYGLDLQRTLKENEDKLYKKHQEELAKQQENSSNNKKEEQPHISLAERYSLGNYQSDFNLAKNSMFNKEGDNTGYRDVFEQTTSAEDVVEPVVEPIVEEPKSIIAEAKDKAKDIVEDKNTKEFNKVHFTNQETAIEPVEEEQPKDFSYSSIVKEEKEKIYEKYDIEEPTGELFDKFVKEDIDNSPVNAKVNAEAKTTIKQTSNPVIEDIEPTEDVEADDNTNKRSDFGGTHKKKSFNIDNIQFVKEALGKTEEKVEEVKTPVKPEKYPYTPKYMSDRGYKYIPPAVDLLQEYDTHYANAVDYEEKGRIIEETLLGLGIETKVVGYTQGPAFSRYELEIDATTNLNRLVNTRDNLSLALATKGSVFIEAPIRGKSLVGVEVPNDKKQIVGLREAISSKEFYDKNVAMSIVLGKDISGKIHVGDLKSMTHMLIAGSTGSGKSVCLNCILTSLLFKYSPEELRLILVDPKMVELSVYNGLPHMLIPRAIIEPDQVISALKWLDREMERRLEIFAKIGSRDLAGYNKRVKHEERMPRIILVIDEFADIMMQSQKIGSEMEELISRIARMARAVGIHMILATQRPSADYITGSIKANIPTRIAFATANSLNSRIILDSNGAEKLLGRGDMLYLSRDPEPKRMQCPFLSDDEVANITDFIRDNNEVMFDERIQEDILENGIDKPQTPEVTPQKIENKAKLDEMFLPVLKFLIIDNYNSPPSITKVQREFEMGFPRAAGLLDKMTKLGFLVKDGKKYVLNISMEDFEANFGDDIDE